jgi:Fe2+ transport system protein B
MGKKWVFNSLVTSDNDPIGLLAYSLYKFQKDEIGKKLRSGDMKEPEIAQQLSSFHDATLHSDTALRDFRDKAVRMIELIGEKTVEAHRKRIVKEYEAKSEILTEEKKEFDKSVRTHDRMVKKEKTKIKNNLLEQFRTTVDDTPKKSTFRKVFNWLVGGFSGIAAQIIVIVITFGLLAIFTSNTDQLVKKFAENIAASITSSPNVDMTPPP